VTFVFKGEEMADLKFDGDIYYKPESHGLKIFAELDEDDLSYEFDMIVVWQRLSDKKLFWARDSGCSCPSPFENFASIEDLNILPETLDVLELQARELGFKEFERRTFMLKVKAKLRS
jgi:hypothetical protein